MSCVRVKMNVFMDDFVVISIMSLKFNLFRIVQMSYLIPFWISYRMFCTVYSLKHYCLCFCLLVIDYCSFGNHSCDHHCVSVLNGFYCRCNEGYTLQEDGKTCQCMYEAPDRCCIREDESVLYIKILSLSLVDDAKIIIRFSQLQKLIV